jgi:hypothetical protein
VGRRIALDDRRLGIDTAAPPLLLFPGRADIKRCDQPRQNWMSAIGPSQRPWARISSRAPEPFDTPDEIKQNLRTVRMWTMDELLAGLYMSSSRSLSGSSVGSSTTASTRSSIRNDSSHGLVNSPDLRGTAPRTDITERMGNYG